MALELAFLKGPLPVTASPGLESVDPRLAELTALAERGQYAAAADKVEELVGEGIYDIRALSFYFYAVFFARGFAGLVEVLDALDRALGPDFEAIGPAKRRQEHFDKRLAWLFETIADAVEYHEKKGTRDWERWRATGDPATLEAASAAARAVADRLEGPGWDGAAQRLGRLRGELRKHANAFTPKAEPQTPQPPAAPPAGGPAAPEARLRVDPGSLDGVPRLIIEIEVSHHFLELCQKLRAFEALIEKGQFERAALVSDDVLQAIDKFDPRLYFPELFARFSGLMSKNIGKLAPHWGDRESVAWKALRQYYRVDLKGFIEG